MTAQTDAMRSESIFDFSEGGNITYRVRDGGVHDMNYVKMYLYNVLPQLWPAEEKKSAESTERTEVSYYTDELHCTNEGEDIFGIAYVPETNGAKVPLVIFSHELGNTHTSGIDYAEALASQGIAVYIFDYRNGSSSSRSGRDMSKMSVMTEVSDLEAVIETAKTWDFVDADRIVLMGGSQGGFVTAATAAKHTDEIAGVILLYPAFVIVDDVHSMFSSVNDIPATFSYRGWFTAGRLYAADVWDYDIYNEINAYDKPVLILHGDRDYMVDPSYSERAAESYADAEYHVIHGAGHGFYGSTFDEAFTYIEDYLTRIGIR